MAHGDVGRLMEYVDGELALGESSAVREHVDQCPECKGTVEELSRQKARLRAVLASLDADSAVAAARTSAALRERAADAPTIPISSARTERATHPLLAQRGPAPHPQRVPSRWLARVPIAHAMGRRQLAQAAVFVLFVAGGVSALVPGSPLRRILEGSPEAPQEVAPAVAPQTPQPEMRALAGAEMRVRAGQAAGSLRVSLQMTSGAELLVALVDGDSAAVVAPPDAVFGGTDGLVEANAPSGPVRVELPRAVADVSLEVGGQLYLRVRSGRLELTAPATARSESQVSFRIP